MAGYIGNKAVNLSTSGADISGTTNLDAVDIDGAVNMATTALVTGVLTTTAAPVFNGGFASNAACTITTADNLSGLIVASTDADANAGPTIQLFRNSSSPADNDLAGNLLFVAENDASEATVYANLGAHLQDVTNGTEDGKFFINTIVAGAEKSRLFMTSTETVFNEESIDLDFRVESDASANALFVQGSSGNVGIGTSSVNSFSGYTTLEINNATNGAILDLSQGDTMRGRLVGTTSALAVETSGSIPIVFQPGGTERMRIDATGAVTMPHQPAFLVQPASQQDNISNDGNLNVIAFGTERFDQNADFGSNVFTAPVAGKYHFDVNLFLLNVDSAAAYYSIRLITTNRSYTFDFDPDFGQDATRWNVSFSALADMSATHTAGLSILQASGTSQTDIAVESYFSGHLVA